VLKHRPWRCAKQRVRRRSRPLSKSPKPFWIRASLNLERGQLAVFHLHTPPIGPCPRVFPICNFPMAAPRSLALRVPRGASCRTGDAAVVPWVGVLVRTRIGGQSSQRLGATALEATLVSWPRQESERAKWLSQATGPAVAVQPRRNSTFRGPSRAKDGTGDGGLATAGWQISRRRPSARTRAAMAVAVAGVTGHVRPPGQGGGSDQRPAMDGGRVSGRRQSHSG